MTRMTRRPPTPFIAAAAGLAMVMLAGRGTGAERPPPLAALRAEVEAACLSASDRDGFDERAGGVRRLADLHQRLAADPRSGTVAAVRGLQRRVAGELVRAGLRLRSEAVVTAQGGPPTEAAGTGDGGRRAEAQSLIDLIQATVRPESWDVHGGRGTIVYFANGHGLVVLAPEDVHHDLGDLLRQLR